MFHAQASDSSLFVQHPENPTKTYLFFDNVHLLKNIRNNLLNLKKFVFPEFSFSCLQKIIVSKGNYISWDDMKNIYNKDSKLSANFRKACKLSLSAISPYKNKQNVSLALAMFHETTISAAKCYIPKRQD